MIQVSQNKLNQVEYLLDQSAQGNHVLFGSELIREAFLKPTKPLSPEESEQVAGLIENLIALDTLEDQKKWLSTLPEDHLHTVVKTYINIVENKLYDEGIGRH